MKKQIQNNKTDKINTVTKNIFSDLRKLIEESRQKIAVSINSEMTYLYWNIGKQIHSQLIRSERAAPGEKIVVSLAKKLTIKLSLHCGDNTPIGLILCAGKSREHVELLQLEKSNIRVADYFTILPPKKLLEEKLLKAIEIAKNKLKNSEEL